MSKEFINGVPDVTFKDSTDSAESRTSNHFLAHQMNMRMVHSTKIDTSELHVIADIKLAKKLGFEPSIDESVDDFLERIQSDLLIEKEKTMNKVAIKDQSDNPFQTEAFAMLKEQGKWYLTRDGIKLKIDKKILTGIENEQFILFFPGSAKVSDDLDAPQVQPAIKFQKFTTKTQAQGGHFLRYGKRWELPNGRELLGWKSKTNSNRYFTSSVIPQYIAEMDVSDVS